MIEGSIWRQGNLVLSEEEQSRAEKAAKQYIEDASIKIDELRIKKVNQLNAYGIYGMMTFGILVATGLTLGQVPLAITIIGLVSQLFTYWLLSKENEKLKKTNNELRDFKRKLDAYNLKVHDKKLKEKIENLLERAEGALIVHPV